MRPGILRPPLARGRNQHVPLAWRGDLPGLLVPRVGALLDMQDEFARTPDPPPLRERSVWLSVLHTASDGQRFFVAMTNSTVTKVTVRAPGGTFLSASALPEHLDNASFFVLSLGRERGPCYGLCLGSVTYSLWTRSGPALIDGGSSMTIQDRGGDVFPLSAPVRG